MAKRKVKRRFAGAPEQHAKRFARRIKRVKEELKRLGVNLGHKRCSGAATSVGVLMETVGEMKAEARHTLVSALDRGEGLAVAEKYADAAWKGLDRFHDVCVLKKK